MLARFRSWFVALPYTDPTQSHQSRLFQAGLLAWLGFAVFPALSNFITFSNLIFGSPESSPPLAPLWIPVITLLSISGTLLWIVPLVALVLLRRGHFHHAVSTACLGMLILQMLAVAAFGSAVSASLFLFQIPIALAGLLGGRRLLWMVTLLSIAVVLGVVVGEQMTPPLAGFFSRMSPVTGELIDPPLFIAVIMTVAFFCGATLIVTLLFDRFGGALRVVLGLALKREHELQRISEGLETIVAERTQELQQALAEVQIRADAQARLLDENAQKQAVINEMGMPVIPLSDQVMVMPLVGALDSQRLEELQVYSLQALERSAAKTLILDITGVPVIDQTVGEGLLRTIQAARLMGTEVMLVGIRPEVAQTMVGLAISLGNIRTFSNLRSAVTLIA